MKHEQHFWAMWCCYAQRAIGVGFDVLGFSFGSALVLTSLALSCFVSAGVIVSVHVTTIFIMNAKPRHFGYGSICVVNDALFSTLL